MIDVKRVYPECCADTLLSQLILQHGNPAHYKGISKVGKALEKFDNDTVFVIGMVDTDKFKREEGYIKAFTVVVEDKLESEDLIIKKVPDTNKHIIRLHPEFEPWIWKIANQYGINPVDYGFNTLTEFYKTSKREEIVSNANFKRFVNAVVIANPPPIQTLRKWLEKVNN